MDKIMFEQELGLLQEHSTWQERATEQELAALCA
jgi:hypothetical protein